MAWEEEVLLLLLLRVSVVGGVEVKAEAERLPSVPRGEGEAG